MNKCGNDHCIDYNIVKRCVAGMKNNKYDPIYGINVECLKNGPNILFSILAQVFSLMISHGVSSHKFHCSVIVPIIKNKRKS